MFHITSVEGIFQGACLKRRGSSTCCFGRAQSIDVGGSEQYEALQLCINSLIRKLSLWLQHNIYDTNGIV